MSLNKIKSLIWTSIFLTGLWFAACKTTPTPGPPVPPQPETNQTKDSSQSTSSPPGGSAQAEKQEKSETSQTTSLESTAAETPESKQQSQNRQTADDKLAKARDDLRVSQATEKRIATELEELKNSGNASAEDIRNYETYLERVQAMVAENRKMVEKMEQAYAEHSQGHKATGASSELSDQQIPEEQVRDPVADLHRQLDASLTEFDGTLLKEMEKIQTASTAKMRDLAQEAAEAAKRVKGKGDDSESQGETSKQGENGDKESENQQKSGSDKSEDSDSKEAKGSDDDREEEDRGIESSDKSKDMAGKGKGEYGREDEDIVARQLREAAENETDPELKKKLWAEYEEYMKNTQ